MREIKFRGKRIDNNQIVFGCLVNNMWNYSELSQFEKGTKVCEIFTGEYGSDNWIDAVEQDDFIFSVYPHSVSQYTGLKDKNGVEIYEGDIVHILGGEEHQGFRELNEIGVVAYGLSASFDVVNNKKIHYSFGYCPIDEITVMGDIHENPELLNK